MTLRSTATVGRAIDPEPDDGRLDHSICPGVPCPETVLVARMTGGSYLLLAYPDREPAAFVARADADLLHRALQSAFGHPATEAASRNGHPAPDDGGALPTRRVQP